MKIIHLANTDFEFELSGEDEHHSIEQVWSYHPLCLYLQYLPLLYAKEEDAIAVTHVPDTSFLKDILNVPWRHKTQLPTFIPLNTLQLPLGYDTCVSWGASKRVQQWAQMRGLHYSMPNLEVVKKINSKAFSFMHSPHLPDARLIWNSSDLKNWLAETHGKRVLKTCFGLSGRGHHFIDDHTEEKAINHFCEKEWIIQRPLIAEPWVERFFDFSTQWYLDPQKGVQLIGATIFETNEKGIYQATCAGPEAQLFKAYQPFLDEHKIISKKVLEDVLKEGFFGYIGVDAFLYRDKESKIILHPIVEMNGRQTMSLSALWFQRCWFPNQTIRLFFSKKDEDPHLLPTKILASKEIVFHRHLTFSTVLRHQE